MKSRRPKPMALMRSELGAPTLRKDIGRPQRHLRPTTTTWRVSPGARTAQAIRPQARGGADPETAQCAVSAALSISVRTGSAFHSLNGSCDRKSAREFRSSALECETSRKVGAISSSLYEPISRRIEVCHRSVESTCRALRYAKTWRS
jgi:hypothetical protein